MPKQEAPFHLSEASIILERYFDSEDDFGLHQLSEYIVRQKMKPQDWNWLLNQDGMDDELRRHLILAYEADWWDRDKERWEKIVADGDKDTPRYNEERKKDPYAPAFEHGVEWTPEHHALRTYRTFFTMKERGELPERCTLELFSDASGSIKHREVVDRFELEGKQAIRLRTYEVAVVAIGCVWVNPEPYPWIESIQFLAMRGIQRKRTKNRKRD